MQTLMQFKMNKLGKLLGTQIAGVGFLTAVQTQMRLQIGSGRETFLADVALMWLLAGVYKMMLLQMCQLGEALRADVTLEGTLTGMSAKMHL